LVSSGRMCRSIEKPGSGMTRGANGTLHMFAFCSVAQSSGPLQPLIAKRCNPAMPWCRRAQSGPWRAPKRSLHNQPGQRPDLHALLTQIVEDRDRSNQDAIMTAITVTGTVLQQPGMTAQPANASSPAASAAPAPEPDAAVISIAPGTLSASVHPSDATAAQRVGSIAEEISTHNAIADAVARFDWKKFAQTAGSDKAEADREASLAYLTYSTARISRELGESGINAQQLTDQQAAENSMAPGSLLVNSFSFKSGGSAYAVTAGTDGTLIGTRDNQPWKTWKITPTHIGGISSGAATALSTLQGLLVGAKTTTATGSAGLLQVTA
jgi:hypothetical protein